MKCYRTSLSGKEMTITRSKKIIKGKNFISKNKHIVDQPLKKLV